MQPFMYALLCREFCHKFVGASGNLLRCRLGLRRREGEIGMPVRQVRQARGGLFARAASGLGRIWVGYSYKEISLS